MPDQLAVVTGAGRGLGAAIAARLVAGGYRVLGVARTRAQLESQADRLGPLFQPFPADLAIPAEVERIAAHVRAGGGCAVLVNNAGYGGPYVPVQATTDDHWAQVLAVNVTAPFALTRAVLPLMALARFGRIVNIGSVFAQAGGEGSGPYIASKHALLGLTRAVAAENARLGITCNMVSPGFCKTEMTRGLESDARLLDRIPAGRLGNADEVASVVEMLVRPESGYVNGSVITVDGGLSADLRPFPRA
jgi:3-oxoacyl-[acyl-carrier protein] reductase